MLMAANGVRFNLKTRGTINIFTLQLLRRTARENPLSKGFGTVWVRFLWVWATCAIPSSIKGSHMASATWWQTRG